MKQGEKKNYQSLYQLATILNSARSPEDIVRSIVEGVAKAMGAKGCSLMLLTPDKKVLLRTASYGLSDWYVRKGPVSADKSMSETLKGKPVAVLDAATDDRVEYRKQVAQEGIASILSVPVNLRIASDPMIQHPGKLCYRPGLRLPLDSGRHLFQRDAHVS